jgi:hypothetical protein
LAGWAYERTGSRLRTSTVISPILPPVVPSAGTLSAQNGQLMLKSDKLELERGAGCENAKTENQDRYNGKENLIMTVTVRPARENHQPLSALWRF